MNESWDVEPGPDDHGEAEFIRELIRAPDAPRMDGAWYEQAKAAAERDQRPDPLAEPEGYGSRLGGLEHLTRTPGQAERPAHVIGHGRVSEIVAGVTPGDQPEHAGDGTCGWYRLGSSERCNQPRDFCLILGDMAEHINPLDLCASHLVLVFSVPRFWCTLCKLDMKLEKVGRVLDSDEITWLPEAEWPVRLAGRNKPPEKLF